MDKIDGQDMDQQVEDTDMDDTVDDAGDADADNPSGQGDDSLDGDASAGRDPKNIQAENRRKSDEIKSLKAEMAALRERFEAAAPREPEPEVDDLESASQQEKVRKAIGRLKERMGLDDDDVRAFLEISGHQSGVVVGRQTERFATKFADQELKEVTDTLKNDDDFKYVIEKYGSELKDTLKAEKVNPSLWGNERIVKAMLGMITTRHLKDITQQPGKKIDRKIMQEGKSSASSGAPAGVTNRELQQYADTHNLELSDPAVRKAAIRGVQAMKKAKERIDE